MTIEKYHIDLNNTKNITFITSVRPNSYHFPFFCIKSTQAGSDFDKISIFTKSVHLTDNSTVEVGNADELPKFEFVGDIGGADGIEKPPEELIFVEILRDKVKIR